jgi:hypothetical protein
MGRAARVTSIDMLPLLAAALQKFRGQASGVLDDLEIEIRRILEWIHHDRKDYWERELHRAYEKLNQAQLRLQQARLSRRVGDQTPDCAEEKRAVAQARRRVDVAHEKINAVRHWTRVIERAVDDFQRSRARFGAWLDVDFPKAVATLNKMSESLVTYISLEAQADPNAPARAKAEAENLSPEVPQSPSDVPDGVEPGPGVLPAETKP